MVNWLKGGFNWFKGSFFVVSILLTLMAFPPIFVCLRGSIVGSPAHIKGFDYKKPQIEFVLHNSLETAFSLLQISLVLIGATWAMIVVDKKNVIDDLHERFTFICGTVCLVFSCYAYHLFHRDMIFIIQESTADGFVPDLLHDAVLEHYYAQLYGIVAGSICVGLSIVSSRWIFVSKRLLPED